MIGGMRGFLEGKPELIPPDVDLSAAEDGDRAVEILACAAGLDDAAIRRARRAARADLATSAWAVDAAEGIDALLAEVQGRASVLLLTEQADPAVSPVLASIDLAVDEIVDLAVDLAIATILQRMALPSRPAVDDRHPLGRSAATGPRSGLRHGADRPLRPRTRLTRPFDLPTSRVCWVRCESG